jgi:hypothetical protein
MGNSFTLPPQNKVCLKPALNRVQFIYIVIALSKKKGRLWEPRGDVAGEEGVKGPGSQL